MRIDKEKFNQLKQLDRIEYRQRIDKIGGINFGIGNVLFLILILSSIFLCTFIILYEITGNVNESLLNITNALLKLGLLIVIIQIILIVVSSVVQSKLKKELFDDYFKIEVKK